MGDHGLHRLALRDWRAWLYQPRHRQVQSGSDRSEEWNQELRIRTCRAVSDHRANHGAGTRVPSARDRRHRSGDVRFGQHRAARSMARQDRGQDGKERAVACGAPGRGGARGRRTCGRGRCRLAGEPIRRRGAAAGSERPNGPLRRGGASHAGIRVLRRGFDPDSFADAGRRPQALLHFRRHPELGGSLVLRSGAPRSPAIHRQGKRGYRAQRQR